MEELVESDPIYELADRNQLFRIELRNGLDFLADQCEIYTMKRIQQDIIVKDLARKMVFITGPRQVGKTSLALAISNGFEKSLYLNYDNFSHRDIIHKADWMVDTRLLILDELHKMDGWKNYLKGIYDTKPAYQQILVTGSARLDAFRQSGDSLAGRFFRHRLNPLSMAPSVYRWPDPHRHSGF